MVDFVCQEWDILVGTSSLLASASPPPTAPAASSEGHHFQALHGILHSIADPRIDMSQWVHCCGHLGWSPAKK